jgi:enoyl-CoA hydratase
VVDADALPKRALALAHNLARLSPAAFAQTKKQLRQDVADRVERSGATTDAAVTDIWTQALDDVHDYVARTLNKG